MPAGFYRPTDHRKQDRLYIIVRVNSNSISVILYKVSHSRNLYLTKENVQESRYSRDKERDRSQYFKEGIMDKIVYESSNPCVEADRYAVAILQDKELHCTPVQGMRLGDSPGFHYALRFSIAKCCNSEPINKLVPVVG